MIPTKRSFYMRETILLIKVVLISSISCSNLPSLAGQINMSCLIEYKSFETVDIKFWFQFDSNINTNMTDWKYGLEICDPKLHNRFCLAWKRKKENIKSCKVDSDFRQVFCIKQINLYAEVRSTKPYHYRFFASHRSKVIVSKEIGTIRYLECGCKYFDFGQKLKRTFLHSGKAGIEIGPFYDIPRLIDTKLHIDPNNVLNIKKYSDKYFEISGPNICPAYSISVKLETWPTCSNWKIKPILLDFPIESLTVNDVFCKFSQTHATLSKIADTDNE